MYSSAPSSWCSLNCRLLICEAVRLPGLNVRRSQMSAVLQVVRMTAPGVPAVPKPPLPVLQAASLKPVFCQPEAGVLVVYFQLCPVVSDVGTTDVYVGTTYPTETMLAWTA